MRGALGGDGLDVGGSHERTGDGHAGEVGRFIRLDPHDAGVEHALRAEVLGRDLDRAVLVVVRDRIHAEGRVVGRPEIDALELRVVHRDAPVVVADLVEEIAHVEVGLVLVVILVVVPEDGGRGAADAGIPDEARGEVRIGRNLDAERRVVGIGHRPLEVGTRTEDLGLLGAGGVEDRARTRVRSIELAHDGREKRVDGVRVVLVVEARNAVAGDDEVCNVRDVARKTDHRAVVGDFVVEVVPLDVELAVGHEVGFGDDGVRQETVGLVKDGLGGDAGLVDGVAVDGVAHHAHAALGGAVGELLGVVLTLRDDVLYAVDRDVAHGGDGAGDGVERVARIVEQVDAGRRAVVGEFEARLAAIPADVHAVDDAVGLAFGVVAVAVDIEVCFDAVEAFADVAGVAGALRFAEEELEMSSLEDRDVRGVDEAERGVLGRHRDAGRLVDEAGPVVGDLADVDIELAGDEIHLAILDAVDADVGDLAVRVVLQREAVELAPGEVGARLGDVRAAVGEVVGVEVVIGAGGHDVAVAFHDNLAAADVGVGVDIPGVVIDAGDLHGLELERGVLDVARGERAADDAVGPVAEDLLGRDLLAGGDPVGGVGLGLAGTRVDVDYDRHPGVRVDDGRRFDRVGDGCRVAGGARRGARGRGRGVHIEVEVAVVGDVDLEDRARHILLLVADGGVRGEVGEDGGRELVVARFGEDAPAVDVAIVGLEAVPLVARGVVGRKAVFPFVLDHVVVGEDFADVEVAHLVEVVGVVPEAVLDHVDGVGVDRREGDADAGAVDGGILELEHFGEEVFHVVGEAVVVVIVGGAALDAVERGPPVGKTVGIGIALVDVVGELLDGVAVFAGAGEEVALGEVAGIGLGDGHENAVALERGARGELVGEVGVDDVAIAAVEDELFPPVGQVVAIGVERSIGPRGGRALAVPEVGVVFREGGAERDEVGAVDEGGAELEVAALGELGRGGRALVRETPPAEHRIDAVARTRIRVARVRDAVGGDAVAGRGVVAREALVPVHRVGHALVERREVRDGVLDPRQDVGARVDGGLHRGGVPPADLRALGHDLVAVFVVDEAVVEDAEIEAAGLERDAVGVIRGRELREVVVEHQLRREGRVAVHVVACAVCGLVAPFAVDFEAVLLDVFDGEGLGVGAGDFGGGTRAVPDADFGDVALEVVGELVEEAVGGEYFRIDDGRDDVVAGVNARARAFCYAGLFHEGGEELGLVPVERGAVAARADDGHRRRDRVAAVRIRLRGSGVLADDEHAVRRQEFRVARRARIFDAVDVDAERRAVERKREVRPCAEFENRADDLLGREDRSPAGDYRIVGIEEAVCVAVRVDADAEVGPPLPVGVDEGGGGILGAALDEGAVLSEFLGLGPEFDGELVEDVGAVFNGVEVLTEHARIVGDDNAGIFVRRGLAVQVEGGAARGIGRVERIALGHHGLDDFMAVAAEVAVRVVAFVLFEREHVLEVDAVERAVRVRVELRIDVARVERIRLDDTLIGVILRGVAHAGGSIRHPQRRGVGVESARARHVAGDGLVEVANAVAVGVDFAAAREPRGADEVEAREREKRIGGRDLGPRDVDRVERGRLVHLLHAGDGVGVGVDYAGPDVGGGGDDVAGLVLAGDDVGAAGAAVERVQAVVDFPVVVHAVVIGIGADRARGDVFVRGDAARADAGLEESHRRRPAHVAGRVLDAPDVPDAVARREVAESLVVEFRRREDLERGAGVLDQIRDLDAVDDDGVALVVDHSLESPVGGGGL